MVGEGGRILYTTDGGLQWYSGGANDDGEYYDIVLQGTRKWITGEKNGFPRLFVSTESGFPWKLCSSVLTENSLSDISFSDSSKGWLVGSNGTLLKTIDGGENWEQKTIFSIHLNSVSTPTDEDIYIGGSNGEFVKSTNGGTSWQVNNIIGYYISDTKIEFFSKYTGYCLAGDQGLLLKTTNAGNSWSDDILSGNYVDQMFFVDSLNGWVVVFPICSGDYLLFRTTNGGETWADTTIIPMVNCIFFLDTKTGWMVNFNALYKTTNAGKDWELSAQLGELSPKQVWFLDESQGYMIGYSGNIGEGLYVTSDGGINWQLLRNNIYLNTLYFNNSSLWGVGDYGKLLNYKWIVTSVENPAQENQAPILYYLSQNFPNPFNPTTTINYSIVKQSYVSIIIYDVLGNEVAKLLDEEKPIGAYSIKFNAEKLSSGIYFYRLQAGDYIETKKMILMK